MGEKSASNRRAGTGKGYRRASKEACKPVSCQKMVEQLQEQVSRIIERLDRLDEAVGDVSNYKW